MTVHLERFPIGDLLDSQICKIKKKEDDTLEGQQYFTTHPLKVHLERFPIGDLLDSQICKIKKKEDDTLEGQQYFTTHPLKIDGKCWEPQFGLTQGCQKGN